jgi:hypothetical protein
MRVHAVAPQRPGLGAVAGADLRARRLAGLTSAPVAAPDASSCLGSAPVAAPAWLRAGRDALVLASRRAASPGLAPPPRACLLASPGRAVSPGLALPRRRLAWQPLASPRHRAHASWPRAANAPPLASPGLSSPPRWPRAAAARMPPGLAPPPRRLSPRMAAGLASVPPLAAQGRFLAFVASEKREKRSDQVG